MGLCDRVRVGADEAKERMAAGYEEIRDSVKDAKYVREFKDSEFWDKLKKFAKRAGAKVTYVALTLFYTLKKDSTPKWAKAAIIAAIGYFILPFDAIADFIPVLGLTDDLGVLTAALFSVAAFVDEGVKAKAKEKLAQWFGAEPEESVYHVIEIDQQIDARKNEGIANPEHNDHETT